MVQRSNIANIVQYGKCCTILLKGSEHLWTEALKQLRMGLWIADAAAATAAVSTNMNANDNDNDHRSSTSHGGSAAAKDAASSASAASAASAAGRHWHRGLCLLFPLCEMRLRLAYVLANSSSSNNSNKSSTNSNDQESNINGSKGGDVAKGVLRVLSAESEQAYTTLDTLLLPVLQHHYQQRQHHQQRQQAQDSKKEEGTRDGGESTVAVGIDVPNQLLEVLGPRVSSALYDLFVW